MQYKIYKLENKRTGKIYIGSTCDYTRRIGAHFSRLKVGNHPNSQLQADYNAGDEFDSAVIDVAKDKAVATKLEKEYINEYADNCYNVKYNSENPNAIESKLSFAISKRKFTLEDGFRMKILRDKLGLSYYKLAEKYNCTPMCVWFYVNRYIAGNTQKGTYVKG